MPTYILDGDSLDIKGSAGPILCIQIISSFELWAFPCRSIIRLATHRDYMKCFLNESIFIIKQGFCLSDWPNVPPYAFTNHVL